MKKLLIVAMLIALCPLVMGASNKRKANQKRLQKTQAVAVPGKECLNPGSNPAANLELPVGEEKTVCTSGKGYGQARKADPDVAMAKVFPYLNNACSTEREQELYIVQEGVDFSLRRADAGDGTRDTVKGQMLVPADKKLIVATIHNHPSGTPWPSEEDVKSALENGCNCYIRACGKNGVRLYVFDVSDGKVYPISAKGRRGRALKQYKDPHSTGRRNDGHDLYDLSKFAEMKAKYAPKKEDAIHEHVSAEPRSRSGYCACANPQVYGRGAYVGKLYKSKYKTQHLGMIGFVCMACGQPIKSLQAQAQAWKAAQTSEGLPTQWYDLQIRYMEGMRNQQR